MVDGESAARTVPSDRGKVWRTRDGRRIPVADMTDDHLANVMQFLRRSHRRYVDTVTLYGIPDDVGEYAAEAAASEMADALMSNVEDVYPIYDDLVTEAIRRGLVK
jgi:hypothetical protein